MGKIVLPLFRVVFSNGQSRYHSLPEGTAEWGRKVFDELLWWGDVDIFCEHPAYRDGGEPIEWGVDRVEPAEPRGRPLLWFSVLLMEEGGEWASHDLAVQAQDADAAVELAASYVFLVSRQLVEVLGVEPLAP